MNRLRAFFAFWYDFVIGDDWRLAVGVIAALATTFGLTATPIPSWWLVPAAVVILLPVGLWPSARRARSATSTNPDTPVDHSPEQP